MGTFIDMTNWILSEHGIKDSNIKVIRKATVEEKNKNNIFNKDTYWWCQCLKHPDNPLELKNGGTLRKGRIKNCSCCRGASISKSLKIDMTNWIMEEHGYINNPLKIIKEVSQPEKTGHQTYWLCQCLKHPKQENFILGRDNIAKNNCYGCPTCNKERKIIDMTNWNMSEHGWPFSNIKVIKPATKEEQEHYKSKGQYWWCQCLDHPNNPLELILGSSLRSGDTQHCSCCKIKSRGEEKIQNLLKQNNISYQREKSFQNLKYNNSNQPVRFDFYVDNKYIIEYDGLQHYYASGFGWNTNNTLILTKERDQIRNEYCKTNNIPLIRIPYTHLNQLCIEDLLLETTEFRYC